MERCRNGVKTIRTSKKDALLDAAIESYAKDGEQGLTTKNLARVANCSEALIYRHFKSKDDLLRACYLRLHKRANEYFKPMEISDGASVSELIAAGEEYWIKAFKFYVEAGYESLFHFWFRMSDAFVEMLKDDNEDLRDVYESSFMTAFEGIRTKLDLQISADHYRTYIVFATGTFLAQVVTGKLPNTEESYKMMADLIFGGLMSTFPGNPIERMAERCNL